MSMAEIPGFLLVHTVTVQPYAGTTGNGKTYGASVAGVACMRDDKRKLVRNSDAVEVVSETTLFLRLAHAASFPPESLVDLGDRTATVITTHPRTDGGLGAWQHLEVTLT